MPVVQLLGTHVLITNPVMNNALRRLCPLGVSCHNITGCRNEMFSVTRNIDKYLSQWLSILPSRSFETSEIIANRNCV